MKVSLQSLLSDARWRLCALDPEQSAAVFNNIAREDLDSWNFADEAFLASKPGGQYVSVAMADIQGGLAKDARCNPAAHYIFHTSLCGSTLLSRCLNDPGKTLSIREPHALLQLAQFKRENANFIEGWPAWSPLVRAVLSLLAKPYEHSEKVIIKPSNSMNNLMEEILGYENSRMSLFLFSGLEAFLVSNLKKKEYFGRYCSDLLASLRADTRDGPALPRASNDLQRAALCWALQIMSGARMVQRYPGKLRPLNSQDWFDHPRAVLYWCNNSLGLRSQVEAAFEREMGKHSKYGGSYNKEQKESEDSDIMQQYHAELLSVKAWVYTVLPKVENSWQLIRSQAISQAELSL